MHVCIEFLAWVNVGLRSTDVLVYVNTNVVGDQFIRQSLLLV